MLCDATLITHDLVHAMILDAIGHDGPSKPIRLEKGFYQISHFSMNTILKGRNLLKLDNEGYEIWPLEIEGIEDANGVCDSPEQFGEKFREILEKSDRKFIVSFTKISKALQPHRDGWRWHKWGPYIGDKTPQYEYLSDEPDIDQVYVYRICELA